MIINEILGITKVKGKNIKITTRQAVRAIIIKNNKLLMVHTNKGDYKFPGGGIKRRESYEEALRREVTEETGYVVNEMGEIAGRIIQRNPNVFNSNGLFEVISYYYFCDVKDCVKAQKLEKYEQEQELVPVWIGINDVIAQNEALLTQRISQINPWVYRETLALRKLREAGIF